MDNTLSTTVTTVSAAAATPWATGNGVLARAVRFINPSGSGAFDFSVNGGATWHTRAMSAGLYSEDFPSQFYVIDLRVRRNGGTDLAGLTIDVFF